jgi:hypothetical protein
LLVHTLPKRLNTQSRYQLERLLARICEKDLECGHFSPNQ